MPKAKASTTKDEQSQETTAPAGTEAGNDLTTPKRSFKRKEAVTVPTRQIDDNETIFITVKAAFDIRDKVDPKTGEVELEKDGKTVKTITVATVVDLQREDEVETPMSLVVGSVLQSNLERKYPEAGYVGKSFEITKRPVEGKRYKAYEVFEIEA